VELSLTWLSGDSTGVDKDAGVAAVEQPQHCNEVRLRLDRDNTGTNAAENAYSIAYVSADVESKITPAKKLPVKRFHAAAPPDGTVVGNEGTGDPGSAANEVSLWHAFRIGVGTDCAPIAHSFAAASEITAHSAKDRLPASQ
jgi:hypothetical protein